MALTPPEPGAVALPDGFDLYLPFPEGTSVRVSCGYGPSCSSYHDGTNNSGSSNDYHALDLVRDEAGGGNGKPVTAMASGRVIYAAWATGGWASFGRLVMIEHDFDGDGETYYSIYAHLSSLTVAVDDHVEAKEEVGLLGGSSSMADDVFGYHVHVALYRNAMVLGGPYGGTAVVPEPMDGYEDIVAGDVLLAGPGPGEGGTTGAETSGGTITGEGTDAGDSATTTSGGGEGGEGGEASEADADDDNDPTGPADGDATETATSGGAIPGTPSGRGDGGCACQIDSHPNNVWFLWLGALVIGFRSRWARRGRAPT